MLETIASYIWSAGLLVLLLGTGVFLTIRLRFLQFRGWRTILKRTFGSLKEKPAGENRTALTQFQTFSTALAAAMGTGNIIGVAAALCIGGPGAVFWMWFSALLGMALTYSENILALRYARTLPDGRRVSGPMAYLRFGLHSRVLAAFYAVCCVAASLGMGNMTQSSAISTLAKQAFSLPPLWTAVGVAVLLGIILLRGTSCTGKVIQWLMPLLSAVYLLAALGVIVTHHDALPGAFRDIFCGAFGIRAVGGGISGAVLKQAVQTGLRHGIFSNEAGLGTGSIAHACADTKKPVKQGMFGIFEVFADTIVICTLTAMVILCSGTTVNYGTAAGAELTISGFTTTYGGWASIFTAVALCCFAFSTIIGWGLYGSRFIAFLCRSDKVVRPFFVVYSFVSILGATMDLGLMWSIADTFNGLMSIPNLIALLLLSGTVAQLTKEYFEKEKV